MSEPSAASAVTAGPIAGRRADSAFDAARAQCRATLVGYLPAGFPTVAEAIEGCRVLADSGVDVIEIGLPYSDPVMDGPVIQRAVERALANGFRVADVFRTVEAVAEAGVPALVMTYWNPIERYGVPAFARDLAAAGGAGLITPDLIPDEAGDWLAASDEYDLDRVFLVAPSSTEQRIAATTAACRGFVYAASVMGVTGARTRTGQAAPALVDRVRRATTVPVGVGLGVSTGAQAAEVAGYADGVIVGSALVRCLLDDEHPASARRSLGTLAADLAAGVRRG